MMQQPTDTSTRAIPGTLLAALEAAQATADSQVRRLLIAMVRVRDADAGANDTQAKDDLGDAAVALHRIHSLLFGSQSGLPEMAAPRSLAELPPAGPLDAQGAAAFGEFQALRHTVQHATSEVERLLAQVEQGLKQFDARWKAAA
jgi:hypothetical protein